MVAGGALRGERSGSREGIGLLVAAVGVFYLLSPGIAAPPWYPRF